MDFPRRFASSLLFVLPLLIAGCADSLTQGKEASSQNDWKNPAIFSINSLPDRSYFLSYDSADAAMRDASSENKRLLSLNGLWQFHFSEDPESRPVNFYQPNFDARCKVTIIPFTPLLVTLFPVINPSFHRNIAL